MAPPRSADRRLGGIFAHVCSAQDARIEALEAELAALKRERAAASGALNKPLAGIRVLEVANWLAAPVAGALMADMGADVIKVEAPTGDTMRYGLRQVNEPGFEVGRVSHRPSLHWPDVPFSQENRGKRSIAVDVNNEAGQNVVHQLAATADVFITNLLPERLERFHLNPDFIMGLNPRLIYASVTGYGMQGASRNTPGFDLTSFQARGGPMGSLGEEGAPPVKMRPGMGDHPTGLSCLAGILAALQLRQTTGTGTVVETSLLRTATFVLGCDLACALNDGWTPPLTRPRSEELPMTNTWQCKGGRWINMSMPGFMLPRYWARFCNALGQPQLINDKRYNTVAAQVQPGRCAELTALLDPVFATKELPEWTAIFEAEGCIFAPIATIGEVAADPQVAASGAIGTIVGGTPAGGNFKVVNAPFGLHGADMQPRGPAAECGEHTGEILEQLGLNDAQIAELRRTGAVGYQHSNNSYGTYVKMHAARLSKKTEYAKISL